MLFRPLATPVGVVLLAALMGERNGDIVEARSPTFLQRSSIASFGVKDVITPQNSLVRSIIDSVPRGGADEGDDDSGEEGAETEVLYLPGLLEVELVASDQPTAISDSAVVLSSRKAKELGVSNGEVVAVIGRRRTATYGRVSVQKKKKVLVSSCTVSENLAKNLRVRKGDTIKIVPLTDENGSDEGGHSGELLLVDSDSAPNVESITLSPIEDSLASLEAQEGGDSISDDDINERFIAPYLEDTGGLLKNGQLLLLKDENGRKLEFLVTNLMIEGSNDNEKKKNSSEEDDEEAAAAGELTEQTTAVVGASTPRPIVGAGYDSVGGHEKVTKLM